MVRYAGLPCPPTLHPKINLCRHVLPLERGHFPGTRFYTTFTQNGGCVGFVRHCCQMQRTFSKHDALARSGPRIGYSSMAPGMEPHRYPIQPAERCGLPIGHSVCARLRHWYVLRPTLQAGESLKLFRKTHIRYTSHNGDGRHHYQGH